MRSVRLLLPLLAALLAAAAPARAQDGDPDPLPTDTLHAVVLDADQVLEALRLPRATAATVDSVFGALRCSAGALAIVCRATLETDAVETCRQTAAVAAYEVHFDAPPELPRDDIMVTVTCAGHETVAFSHWKGTGVEFVVNTRHEDGREPLRHRLVVVHGGG